MNDQKQILSAYLTEALAEHGMELDSTTLDLINDNLTLEARRLDESDEVRSIKQTISSSGKHSATSYKLANIARLSMEDILKFIGKSVGVALFDDTAKKIVYSIVMLLIDFYPKLKIQFSEQEAQLIFAISKLPDAHFTVEEIGTIFAQIFPPGLPDNRLADSLAILTDNGVLRQTGLATFQLRERIKNLERSTK